MSTESVMPFNHLILCHPLLLLPPIFPSIRVFPKELALCIRGPKHWSFSFSVSPSNECSGLISLGLTGLISLQSKGLLRVFSSTTVQKHQFFSAQPSYGLVLISIMTTGKAITLTRWTFVSKGMSLLFIHCLGLAAEEKWQTTPVFLPWEPREQYKKSSLCHKYNIPRSKFLII